MDILIVAPSEPGLSTGTEIARVASGNTPTICDGYVSRQKFATMLAARQFDAIHYAGHGTYDILQLSDGPLSAEELQTLVKNQKRLRLVVLNSCLGAGTAAELHNVLDIPIISYQGKANDAAAIRYAEALYMGLSANVPLAEAHARAKNATRRAYPDVQECDLPVLINGAMTVNSDFQAMVLRRFDDLDDRMLEIEATVRAMQPRSWERALTVLMAALLLVALVDLWIHLPV